jgi:hypothetical protein
LIARTVKTTREEQLVRQSAQDMVRINFGKILTVSIANHPSAGSESI